MAADDHWRVTKGEPAPMTGQCMTIERSLRIGRMANECSAVVEIELTYANRLRDADVKDCQDDRKVDAEVFAGKAELLAQQLDEASDWKRHPALWYAGGIVTVIVAILLTRETMFEGAP